MAYTSPPHALSSVCKASRAALGRFLGGFYKLEIREDRRKLPEARHKPIRPVQFYYVPSIDTIHLQGEFGISEFGNNWSIKYQLHDKQMSDCTAVRSVSLEGFWGRATYPLDPNAPPLFPRDRTSARIGSTDFRGHSEYAVLSSILTNFFRLEELILITPPWTDLAKLGLQYQAWREDQSVSSWDAETCEWHSE